MAVSVPTGEQKSTPISKAEQKAKLQTASPERSNVTYKKADVIRPRGKETNESFSIQKTTEKFLAERVQNFIMTMEDTSLSTAKPEQWQTELVKQFKNQFPDYDAAKLQDYALQFVQTHQGLIVGHKIAEWELATYQRATGAYIEEVQNHRESSRAFQYTAGREASVTPERTNILTRLAEKAGIGLKPAEKRERADEIRQAHRAIQERDGNYYFAVDVGSGGPKARTVLKFLEESEGAPESVKYDATNLDTAQKVLLARRGLLLTDTSGNITAREFNDSPVNGVRGDGAVEKQHIADLLAGITQARVDIYQATGKPNVELNAIQPGNAGYRGLMQTPHLRLEQDALLNSGQMSVNDGLKKQFEFINAEFKKQSTEALKQKREQERKGQVMTNVNNQIVELGQNGTQTEAEKRRLTELSTSIPQTETDIQILKKPQEITAEIGSLQTRKTQIETEVNTVDSAHPNLITEIAQLDRTRAKLKELKEERASRIQARDRLVDRISNLPRGSTDTITAIEKQIDALDSIIGSSASGLTNEIAQCQTKIEGIEDLSQMPVVVANMQELDRINTEITTKLGEKPTAETEVKNLLTKTNTEREKKGKEAYIDEAAMQTDLEERLKSQKAEQAQLELANVGRERQKEALETYRDKILTGEDLDDPDKKRSSLDGIHNRAQNKGRTPLEYSSEYSAYPESYLRVIQIMFGHDAIMPGSEQVFARVTQLLPPEKVQRMFAELNGGSNIDLKSIRQAEITSKFITYVVSSLQKEVMNGNLGQYSDFSYYPSQKPEEVQAAIKPQFQEIRRVKPNTELKVTENSFVTQLDSLDKSIYHYEGVDDLTRRILDQWNRDDGADYSKDERKIADAKRYAEEIEKKRPWRRRLHEPQISVQQTENLTTDAS